METFKVGTDRDIVAQFEFGRAAQGAHDLVKLNNDVMKQAADLAQKLGLVMGTEGVEHTLGYKRTINELKVEFEAFGIAIGEAILPYLQKLSSWMADEGVVVIQKFRQAMETLKISITTNTDVWTTLLDVLKAAGNVINAVVRNIITPVQTLITAVQGGFKAIFPVGLGAAQ